MLQIKSTVRIIKTVFLLGIVITFLASCGGAKHTTETVVNTKKMKPEEYLAQSINYKTFSGKAQMQYSGDGDSQDFTANIRMNKDKDIWASITALGGMIEAARAYITPQELKAINRLKRSYYQLSYEEGLSLLQAQVSFEDLQNLIVGNPLMSDNKITSDSETENEVKIVVTKDDIKETLLYDKKTGTLQSIELNSDARAFQCIIKYSAYGPTTGKQPFAYNRILDITNKGKKVQLTMNFNKAELDIPVDVSFSIPSSYDKAVIKK